MIVAIIIALVSFLSLSLGIIALRSKSRARYSFSLFSFCVAAWVLVNFIFQATSETGLIKSFYAFGALAICAGIIFTINFLFDRIRIVILVILSTLGLANFFISLCTNRVIEQVDEVYVAGYKAETGGYFPIYSLFIIAGVLTFFIISIYQYKKSIEVKRNQIRWVMIGFGLFGAITAMVSFVLPLFGVWRLTSLDSPSAIFFVVTSFYAITRYRFLDIRLILRKSFIYVGIAGFTYVMFYFVAWLYQNWLGGVFSATGYLAGLLIAPLFVASFYGIEKLLKTTASKYFFTGLYDYQAVLETFAKKVSKTIKLDEVVTLIMNTIQGAMRVDDIALALADKTNNHPFLLHKTVGFNKQELENICSNQHFCSYLQSVKQPIVIDELLTDHEKGKDDNLISDAKLLKGLGVALVLPFVVKDKINSVCVVGRKITKEAYTKEDIDLLTTLSNQASVAIENARLYQKEQQTKEILESFSKELEKKVNEQTKEIGDKNIHLQKLLKAQSEFLDIASHQLRTPVSLIKGITTMILEGDMDKLPKEKKDEFLRAIVDKSGKLEIIINDILSASEFDSQKFAARPNSPAILLEDVVDAAVADAQTEAKQRNIELKWQKPAKPLPKIIGEQKYLEQALYNLVSNALKYTPSTVQVKEARADRKTKGVVEVSMAKENNNLVVKIKDNGIGIPKEEIPKLFIKFARASNATAMYTDGSGLGLFIVKEIIEGHHGKVWVESEIGKGSTFFVRLPTAI